MSSSQPPEYNVPTTIPSQHPSGASDMQVEAGPSRARRSSLDRRTTSPEQALGSVQPSPTRSPTPHLDLISYNTPTLLRQLASLLQQIATANDQLRPDFVDDADDQPLSESSSAIRSGSRQSFQPNPSPTTALFSTDDRPPPASLEITDPDHPLFTASRTSLSHPSSLLSFHARHIPSISIEAYLLRILKYCPTTNEVFIGLLVYFDRMSRLGTAQAAGGLATGTRGGLGRGFAIDSYNVHRLVIAGVTVASKFFSDVFYTNSRYAKVGGLPPHELNQLELQFLLLNDFRLVIPSEEMQRYGDRLLGYWEGLESEDGPGDAAVQTVATQASVREKVGNGESEAATGISQAAASTGEESRTQATAADAVKVPATTNGHTVRRSSNPNPSTEAPPPAVLPRPQPAFSPRGKERETSRASSTSYVDPHASSSAALTSGLRDWVRGDEVLGVMRNRMTSPMRD